MALEKFLRFVNDVAGIEKILRLLQSFCQIIAAYAISVDDEIKWLRVRKQFALGRRYIRFFKFIDNFSLAYTAFRTRSGFMGTLEVVKWSCWGIYLMFESSVILDAMSLWEPPWAKTVMREANKFWFYAICFSILETIIYALGLVVPPEKEVVEKDKASGKGKIWKRRLPVKRTSGKEIVKKLVLDGCDLLVPGHHTGWIRTNSALVGEASVMSTILTAAEVWRRVNEGYA